MTRAETDLLIQLSKDTNKKLSELSARFNGHVVDDKDTFSRLEAGMERQDTRWRIIKWVAPGVVTILGILLGLK